MVDFCCQIVDECYVTNRLEVMRKDLENYVIIEGVARKSVFGRFEKATIIQQHPTRKEQGMKRNAQLLPLIAGISYELIRLSARFPKNIFFRIIMKPGLWLQKITTRPPSDDMLDVSLRALQEALTLEEQVKKEKTAAEAA